MCKSLQLLVCIVLFAAPALAQDKKFKGKYGKITEEEIAMKSCKDDPAAPAVVLFDRAEFSNRFNTQQSEFLFDLERHVRIKIFNKEAYDLADVAIFHFKDEKIIDLKASSYNMENGVLVETKLDKENVFDEKLTRIHMVKKLTIPAVKEGTIIEYRYTRTNMGADVPNWVFQDTRIPKLWSEYKASVPTFIEYNKIAQGEVPFLVAEEDERPKTASGLTYQCREMHYIQENIPALKPEPYVNSVGDYLSQINFDIRTIYKPRLEPTGASYGYRLMNGAPMATYSWENLGRDLLEDMYDKTINSTQYTAAETAACITGKTTTLEKTAALYEFVGKNYQSGNFDMIWARESMENITKNRKGTPTELNLVLINMLRRAGLQAFPIAISTLDNGRILPYRVTMETFDRVLTVVENDDKTLTIIDASAWPHPFGFLPQEDLNHEGLLLRSKDDISWLPLQNKSIVRSAVQASLALDPEGKLSGTMSFSESGYGAVTARKRIGEKDAPAYLRAKFPELFTDGSFNNLKMENLENWQEPSIKGSFDFEATGFATVSGNKIYLNPSLGFGLKENPFKNPERKFNIELGVPSTMMFSFVFSIPKGYKVEEAPKPSKMTFGDNGLIFEYFMDLTPESVKVTIRRSIRQPFVAVDQYADLQQFYGNIVSKLEEQIVFTKL